MDIRRETVRTFFERIHTHDVDGAMGLVASDATINLQPLRPISKAGDLRAYLTALVRAFPDLSITARNLFVGTDGTAVVEVTLDGVQADDFLGIVDQEKHMDVDQAWLLHVGDDGHIDRVAAYWCQNQVYRRLAVKRLDKVTITAA